MRFLTCRSLRALARSPWPKLPQSGVLDGQRDDRLLDLGSDPVAKVWLAPRLLDQGLDATSVKEFTDLVPLADEAGDPIPFEERPMIVALHGQRPAHRRFSIRGFDGVVHNIEGLGFPLVVREGRQLGAVGIFWERVEA